MSTLFPAAATRPLDATFCRATFGLSLRLLFRDSSFLEAEPRSRRCCGALRLEKNVDCFDVLLAMSMPPHMDREGALLGMSMTGMHMEQTMALAQGSMSRAVLAYQNMNYDEAEHELDRAELLLSHSNMGIRVLCSLYELGKADRLGGARSDPSAAVNHHQAQDQCQHRQLQPLHGPLPAQQLLQAELQQQLFGRDQDSGQQEGAVPSVGSKRCAAACGGAGDDTEGEPEVVSRRRRTQSARSI